MKPTIQYLPQWHKETDQQLYQKMTEILDHIVKDVEFEISGLRNKYLDYSTLTKDLTEIMIQEMGYSYITEVLDLSEEQLHVILGYLGVIHAFKGTKAGLELCLQLMGAKYTITEWWEANPTRTPDTFSLLIDLNLSGMKRDTMTKLHSFVRQYVYPVMDAIEYTFQATLLDLSIRMGGGSIHEVSPGAYMMLWMMARMGGGTIRDVLSHPANSATFWIKQRIAGICEQTATGQVPFFLPHFADEMTVFLTGRVAGVCQHVVTGTIPFFS
jgi:hypothetical protein